MIAGLPDRNFWRGRRVLLTGHTGFKGAWLLFWLEAMGARVTGCSLSPDRPEALFSHLHAAERLASEIVDIRDPKGLAALVARTEPEVVLHLAAQSLVRRGYSEPHATFETNVSGTNNLLRAIAEVKSASALVVTTTDKVYRNCDDGRPFVETDPLGGHDPYSASKAACEMVVDGWRSRLADEGCAVATARAGNVIGGGDWAEDRLIPDAVRAWSSGRVLQVRRPDATRPWQHVLEPLRGYLVLAERLASGQDTAPAFNFGPRSESASVRKVLSLAAEQFGAVRTEFAETSQGPAEAHALALDPSLAETVLAVRGLWDLQQTVTLTAGWYRAFLAGRPARDLCEADLTACLDTVRRASMAGIR
ncbi:CDP-glucose 4,6-dehydratase [Hoeflea halophila]|uniref:CDP-glucose 4,6-dehydratase n=1 Tax=Hoeflea halophila TaxID=714899 RepID=A0A286IFE5_9HYPH|nr:CDP-glucose 4,6-dehydratase [Hoeflea halophila]